MDRFSAKYDTNVPIFFGESCLVLVVLVRVILCVDNRYYYNHSSNRSMDTTAIILGSVTCCPLLFLGTSNWQIPLWPCSHVFYSTSDHFISGFDSYMSTMVIFPDKLFSRLFQDYNPSTSIYTHFYLWPVYT